MPLGTGELMIILIIVVVVFGATKLPQLGDGLGKAIRNFKRSVDSTKSELDVTPKEEKQEKRELKEEASDSDADKQG